MTVEAHASSLAHHEEVIERGLGTFVEVGRALAAIRDERLYLASHSSFEAYCDARWQLSKSRAYQYIEAADVTSTIVDAPLPATESQARELRGLEPTTAAAVMRQAHDDTAGKPTAAAVRDARTRLFSPRDAGSAPEQTPAAVPPPSPQSGSNPIADAVREARTGPAHVAGNELERIFTAVRGIKNAGGAAAVAGDLGDGELDRKYAESLLAMLEGSLPLLQDLRSQLARRNLRSVK